jgi:hypothetical protein
MIFLPLPCCAGALSLHVPATMLLSLSSSARLPDGAGLAAANPW